MVEHQQIKQQEEYQSDNNEQTQLRAQERVSQFSIFMAFFRAGMLGYGGGPSSIPLIHKEVVERYRWLDDKEFANTLALGNTLPGPIATKMAGYIGYRVGGMIGMFNAVIATVVPTVLLMILLLTTLSNFQHMPWVAGMTKAVIPVVGVMLAVLTWDFLKLANKDLGWVKNMAIVLLSLVAMEVFSIHPGIIIFALMVFAWIPKSSNTNNDRPMGSRGKSIS